jgi:hypothetical protein
LKQLADKGVIGPATQVRKGEQGAWYQAGTIAGLVPPKPVDAGGPPNFEADTTDRARRTLQKAEEQAEKVAAKLWFLDLKFTRFFTPKLVGALWAIFLCLVVVFFLGSTVYYLATLNALYAIVMIAVQVLVLLFAVISTRIVLEVFLVIFRMTEYLEPLKHLEYLKHLEQKELR